MLLHPGPYLRRGAGRPQAFHRSDRHPRAGDADLHARIIARQIYAAGQCDPEIHVPDLALLDVDALFGRVHAQAHQEAVEHERSGVRGRRRREHDGAAGDLHAPDAAGLARRIELRQQRDAIAAGHDLERHHQRLPGRVPIQADLGTVDRNAVERIIEIDERPLLHQDAPIHHARDAVGTDVGADARVQRKIGVVRHLAPAHRQHQVLGRDLLGLDVDDAMALLARRHCGAHPPRSLRVLRAERHGNAAALGPRHAQIDVGERPLLAIALIVDGQVAALEPDLGEIAAVETAGAEALDPGDQRGEFRNAHAHRRCRRWRCSRRRRDRRRQPCRRSGGAGDHRGRAGGGSDERALVGAREDRDLAVRLDAHRHLGAHQAQSFGADAAGEQSGAGDADLGLGSTGDDRALGVAHHDVANAQGGAAAGVALELRAADLDFVAVAEILLDRRGQPGRGDIELDRAAGEPPPQAGHPDQHEASDRAADERQLAQAWPPQHQLGLPRAGAIGMPTGEPAGASP